MKGLKAVVIFWSAFALIGVFIVGVVELGVRYPTQVDITSGVIGFLIVSWIVYLVWES